MMNQKVKELWVNALRSGEYTQSRHALRTVSGFCCLGVLCDIAAKTGLGKWDTLGGREVFRAKDGYYCADTLPHAVVEWAGLRDRNPDSADGSLASLNDSGKTFDEIADIIQAEL